MKETEKAFHWIIDILEKHNITYRISGGFAARAYGADRELADIDIEVADKDISIILNDVKQYIVFGPARYQDENWDLNLLTLEYLGQEIDIASADAKIFNQQTKSWENWVKKLDEFEMLEIFNRKVPVETMESLISYKIKLAREVDLEDVRRLEEFRK